MTGYTPIITTDDPSFEQGPDAFGNTPENGEQPKGPTSIDTGVLYGFAPSEGDISGIEGSSTQDILDALGEDRAAIGTTEEVTELIEQMKTTPDDINREVTAATDDIVDKLADYAGETDTGVDREEIHRRLLATALEAMANGKTDGNPLITGEVRQAATEKAVGAILVNNVEGIKDPSTKLWAHQLERRGGTASAVSGSDLEALGAGAAAKGITIDTIEETVAPVAEEEKDKPDMLPTADTSGPTQEDMTLAA